MDPISASRSIRATSSMAYAMASAAGLSSALLLTLGFPPLNFSWLAWVALTPWILALTLAPRRKVALLSTLAFAGGLYGWNLRWFTHIFALPQAVCLCAILSLFLLLLTSIFDRLRVVYGRPFALAALPALWVGIEYFRSECWFLKFGWITPGYTQSTNLLTIQAADLAGVYGLSFLVVGVNVLVANGLIALMEKRRPAGALSLGCASLALALTCSYGALREAQFRDAIPGAVTIDVAAIQFESSRVEDGVRLMDQVTGHPRLTVWPELSAEQFQGVSVNLDNASLQSYLARLARSLNTILVVGGRRDIPGGKGWNDTWNSLTVFDPDGANRGYYVKGAPVPLFRDGQPGTDFGGLETQLGRLGLAICYDTGQLDLMRRIGANTSLYVVSSLDPVSWTELQHAQHAIVSPVRCVEMRRWMVRTASSGWSQIIAPTGEIRAVLQGPAPGVLDGTVQLIAGPQSLYAWIGLAPAQIALLFVMLCLLDQLLRKSFAFLVSRSRKSAS